MWKMTHLSWESFEMRSKAENIAVAVNKKKTNTHKHTHTHIHKSREKSKGNEYETFYIFQ